MAYNNYFPVSYAPAQYYPNFAQMQPQQPTQQQQQQTQPINSGFIWVQGEAGAKSYLVAPNTTVQLWDSESQSIYVKSADASGMPSMKILDYTIRQTAPTTAPQAQNTASTGFATKDEVNILAEQITALKAEISGLTKHEKKVKADE